MIGSDFMTHTDSVVFIAGGSNVSCLNITIVDDEAFEGDHNFTVNVQDVRLISGDPETLLMPGSASSATVTIIDNDGMQTHYSFIKIHSSFAIKVVL